MLVMLPYTIIWNMVHDLQSKENKIQIIIELVLQFLNVRSISVYQSEISSAPITET